MAFFNSAKAYRTAVVSIFLHNSMFLPNCLPPCLLWFLIFSNCVIYLCFFCLLQKEYCKNPDTWKISCNHPKICSRWLYHRKICPKGADGMANSADPDQIAPRRMADSADLDQTAPLGAVWSGSTLFVYTVCPDLTVGKLRIIMIGIFKQLLTHLILNSWTLGKLKLSKQCRPRLNFVGAGWLESTLFAIYSASFIQISVWFKTIISNFAIITVMILSFRTDRSEQTV